MVAIDDGATAFPFATNLEDKGTAAANLAHEVGKHGAAAHPLVVGIDDGATALPLGIKAGEEGCLAHPFESDRGEERLAYKSMMVINLLLRIQTKMEMTKKGSHLKQLLFCRTEA